MAGIRYSPVFVTLSMVGGRPYSCGSQSALCNPSVLTLVMHEMAAPGQMASVHRLIQGWIKEIETLPAPLCLGRWMRDVEADGWLLQGLSVNI